MIKKHLIILVFALCSYSVLHAQVYKKRTVYSGESIADKSNYIFPAFINGTVMFKKGGSLVSKMNFNTLICEIQFIDMNNDTLVISKPQDIDSIFIDTTTFYFDNGYHEILASDNNVKLVVLRKAAYEPIKIGALGIPNHSGTGTQTFTSVVTYLGERKLTMDEDIEVTDEFNYLLVGNNNTKTKADKSGFIQLFPSKANDIQAYLKQNKIRFTKEADLIKLFTYCAGK